MYIGVRSISLVSIFVRLNLNIIVVATSVGVALDEHFVVETSAFLFLSVAVKSFLLPTS